MTRRFSPPFARLIAQQQAHEGELRHCHARLVAHAEEVALLEGGPRERGLLDAALERTASFSRRYYLLQFAQGAVDQARRPCAHVHRYPAPLPVRSIPTMPTHHAVPCNACAHLRAHCRAAPRPQWTIKYGASLIGWPVLALPFLSSPEQGPEVAARYREADTLIQNACAPPPPPPRRPWPPLAAPQQLRRVSAADESARPPCRQAVPSATCYWRTRRCSGWPG